MHRMLATSRSWFVIRSARQARALALAALAGALPAAGFAANSKSYVWTGGDFPGLVVPNPLPEGDTLFIVGTDTNRFLGDSFTNLGSVRWRSGSVQGANGATVFNSGLWDSSADTALTVAGSPPTFTNSGTLRKSGGSAATTISWVFANNAGSIDAQTGSIVFNGAKTTFDDGSSVQGAGIVSITADAAFKGKLYADNLVLASGIFTGADARLAGGVATAAGRLAWEGGDLAGTWEIGAGNTLTASGKGVKRQTGGSLVNLGTILWNDATAGFQGGNGAALVNRGRYEAQVDTRIGTFSPVSRNSFVNHASGLLRAADGVALRIDGVSLVNEGGELNAGTGASIAYAGGFARFNDGTRFTGSGSHVFSSDARFVGAFQAANVAFSGGTQSGGDGVSAGSKAILQGSLSWTSGALAGAWEIAPGSVLDVSGAGAKQHAGGSIVNDGSVFWGSGAALQGGNGAAFVNNGLFEVGTSASFTNLGGVTRNTFTNAATGIVRATNGATLTIDAVALSSNGGEFEAGAGSAIVYAGGFAQFNDATRFSGAGTHTVSNDARFVGSFRSANLIFAPGGVRVGGEAGASGSKAIAQGTLEWRGGELQGDWEVAAGGTLTAAGSGAKTQRGGAVLNKGTVAWNADVPLQLAQSARFGNEGVFDVATDADLVSAGAPGTFVNSGRFVKSSGDGVTSLAGVALTSTGVIDVRSGTIVLPDNFQNAGVLAGTGTFALAGMLMNDGHVAPGASPGTLTIDGDFVQNAGGILDIELNSATIYDRLIVKGTAVLGGTLALHCFADCRMAVGETISVLEVQGALIGAFDPITMIGFGAGAFAPPSYDGGVMRLSVIEALAPVPEPATYVLMLAGIGVIACMARRGRRAQHAS